MAESVDLVIRFVGITQAGQPTSGTFQKGDFAMDVNSQWWTCKVAGTPGIWEFVPTTTVGIRANEDPPVVAPIPEWCKDFPLSSGQAYHCVDCMKDFIVRKAFVPIDSRLEKAGSLGPGNACAWLTVSANPLLCPTCGHSNLAQTVRQPVPELFFTFGPGPPAP